MILLYNSVVSGFSYFAIPPTHAFMSSINATFQPNGVKHLHLNYEYGTIDSNSLFVSNPHLFPIIVDIPDVNRESNTKKEIDMLTNLFAKDMAPDPKNPFKSIAISKKEGDWKTKDIDAIVSNIIPSLNGSVV